MGKWIRGQIIGRGSSAAVSLATTASGELMAVKSAELSSSSLLQKERDLISQLNSPFVVKYLGSDITSEDSKLMYNLFMEYFPGGTLSDQIRKQGGSLEEPMIRNYAFHILQGLDYLHSEGIVHCDIKGQNVLVGKDGAKIGDFGCAKKAEEEKFEESNGNLAKKSIISGTPLFMAPEVARGEEQGFAADIWSLGCVVVEMTTGTNPWPNLSDPVSALFRIGYSEDVPKCPIWLSNSAKDFVSKCLNRDAKQRWTAKELLQHPFFAGAFTDGDTGFLRNSPTSVLDQAFWDSMEEVPELSDNDSSHMVLSSSDSSSSNRIKSLVGDMSCFPGSGFRNWPNDDEDWITVRCVDDDDTEEIPQISTQFSAQIHDDLQLQVEEDLLLLPIGSEESVYDISTLLINCSENLNVNIRSTIGSATNLMLSSVNVKDAFDLQNSRDVCPILELWEWQKVVDNCRRPSQLVVVCGAVWSKS
ncbi:OLC1v1036051C1 [Oldenlandia corymbosa var. corymbosa]|uniref:OLC1v1036051C1 n=1 Tax=Oldenlandia corymbosa var. corymbosa TaxID=529605 RepID=A0AAV1CVI2_OLDCO|nr:OLC1v1036051C1 [Oldenlandia corymbosa var. corymbosa]